MENANNHQTITPESLLASFREMLAESSAKFDREMAESRAEFDRRVAEDDRRAVERRAEFEKDMKESSERFEKEMKESDERFEKEMKESSERFEKEMKESSERFEKEMKERSERFDKEMKESNARSEKENKALKEMIGGMGNSNGDYAEEFFYNALSNGQKKMFGEVFDDVIKSNKVTFNKGYEDEYDIILVNGQAVCIVEVKYKADSSDLPQRVLRKAKTFRVNFPHFKDKKVYLALASMSFHPLTKRACRENGIAIMKQVGETMVVSGENLKTF
jgi:hypothetical protein